jgi:hypothetical protein
LVTSFASIILVLVALKGYFMTHFFVGYMCFRLLSEE